MKRMALLVVTLASFMLWTPHPVYATPVVTAGSDTVFVGDAFTIHLSIANANQLGSWQFDLSFNPAIVSALEVREGPFLSESGAELTLFIPPVIDSSGHITLAADAFIGLPGPSGSGVLADIDFRALAVGVSPLTLSHVFLNDLDSGFAAVNGLVTVRARAAAPEPGTLMLLSIGFGVWAARRWRTSAGRRLR